MTVSRAKRPLALAGQPLHHRRDSHLPNWNNGGRGGGLALPPGPSPVHDVIAHEEAPSVCMPNRQAGLRPGMPVSGARGGRTTQPTASCSPRTGLPGARRARREPLRQLSGFARPHDQLMGIAPPVGQNVGVGARQNWRTSGYVSPAVLAPPQRRPQTSPCARRRASRSCGQPIAASGRLVELSAPGASGA